jgi:isopentenyl diphosphate isomerase/L-lactate dehydrogenase-like FMN-dependent dehydrogenase
MPFFSQKRNKAGVDLDETLTWSTIDWLKSVTRLSIIVKGILRPDDAVRAVEHGIAAIWVSNHGGRTLDGMPASVSFYMSNFFVIDTNTM